MNVSIKSSVKASVTSGCIARCDFIRVDGLGTERLFTRPPLGGTKQILYSSQGAGPPRPGCAVKLAEHSSHREPQARGWSKKGEVPGQHWDQAIQMHSAERQVPPDTCRAPRQRGQRTLVGAPPHDQAGLGTCPDRPSCPSKCGALGMQELMGSASCKS